MINSTNKVYDKNLYELICKYYNINILIIFLLILSFAFNVIINIKYVELPILEEHAFRQTQTALTAFYLVKDGFHFAFQTPVIGESWSIPFEFPIYQEIVALFVKFSSIPLTVMGRLISLIFGVLVCLPVYFSLKYIGINRQAILFALSLYLTSPLYIFWSGTFMIETAAIFFCCCYLYYGIKLINRDWSNKNIFLFAFFLLLAFLQKITTVLIPFIFISILVIFYTVKISDFYESKNKLFKIFLSLFIPCLIILVWLNFSDGLKLHNPIAAQLTSNSLFDWNFGSFDQRISKNLWLEIVLKRNLEQNLCGFFGILIVLLNFFLCKSKVVRFTSIGLVILGLTPFLVFTNLYIIHSYYSVASLLFLIFAFGLSVFYLANKYLNKHNFLFSLVLVLILFINIKNYYNSYHYSRTNPITMLKSNERTLIVSDFIKSTTNKDSIIVWYGFDWSSQAAFYSERKSLTVPDWGSLQIDSIKHVDNFLPNKNPAAYVLCPTARYLELRSVLSEQFPKANVSQIYDCDIFKLN